MSALQFNKQPVLIPDERCGRKMKKLIRCVENKYKLNFSDYWDFHKWTLDNIVEFWSTFWDFAGVIHSKAFNEVVDLSIPMYQAPKWFEGAKLNFAENLLKFRDEQIALILAGEDREVERLSYKQLYEETCLYAAALKRLGILKGDCVAGYMSNRKEAVIAMLAVTGIGAIWTGALPTIGPQACLNRLKQVKPKVLITVDQFPNNNETCDLINNIKDVSEGLPSLQKVIIVPSRPESKLKNIGQIKNSCFLDEFLESAYNEDRTVPEMVFEQVSFSHPTFINFTSGTTGPPKSLVHGIGGLLTGVRDFEFHWDFDRDDVCLSMSPVGWVSWNMINNILFIGSTIVLFEGIPYFLSPTYIWDLTDELKLTRLFVTPSVLDEMEARNYLPTDKHHLSSLNMIISGGSVVKPKNFEFILKVKKGIKLAVGCGSTEIMGFCMTNDSMLPIYLGEISTPSLGIAIECVDDEGNEIFGQIGEFLISKPVPSLPLGLLGDTNGDMFKNSYFSKFPGKFAIGDSILINPITKGIMVLGRSDETIKQRETRFGSSEIYNIVNMFPEIRNSLCVGQCNKDLVERAVLFIQMEEGHSFNEELVEKVRKAIAKELTVFHVPDVILETPGIPHNANGKKTEIIVKKIINNKPHNPETVANPKCLQFYYDIPELKGY